MKQSRCGNQPNAEAESCLPDAVELLVRPTSFPPFARFLILLMFTFPPLALTVGVGWAWPQ